MDFRTPAGSAAASCWAAGNSLNQRKGKGTHKRSDDSVAVAQNLGGALASALPLPPPRLHDESVPLRGVTSLACRGPSAQ